MARNHSPFLLSLFLLLTVCFVYLFSSCRLLPLDYDEVANAHSTWSIAQGLRPYLDFHEMHTPFFFMFYAPVIKRLPETFQSLITLRQANALFSIAGLFFLAMAIRASAPGIAGAGATLVATAVMFLQPTVVQTLCDFRSDHLALALVFLALMIIAYERKKERRYWTWALAAFSFTLGIGTDGKLFLIPITAALAATFLTARSGWKNVAVLWAGIVSGIAVGLGALLLYSLSHGVSFKEISEHVFMSMFFISKSFGRTASLRGEILKQAVRQDGLLIIIFLLGIAGAVRAFRQKKWAAFTVMAALMSHSLLQPWLVSFPFKQYVFSVYLAWSGPLALFLTDAARTQRKLFVLLVAVLLGPSATFEWMRWRQIRTYSPLGAQIKFADDMLQITPRDRPISAQPPQHPVFRRDATYSWIETATPDGPSTEEILMKFPNLRPLFSYTGNLQQLNAHPPSLLIVNEGTSMKNFQRAQIDYVVQHPHRYKKIYSRAITIYVDSEILKGTPP